MEKIGRARSLYRSIFHSSRGYIATSSNNQLLAAGRRNYHLSTLPKRLSPGQERNMYISATPSPLPLKPNSVNPVKVGSFDRDERPPTTNAFQEITGNLGTKGKVEEAGGHNHNTMTQIAKHTEEMERGTIIRKGDLININELLFTKNRDYLIRYNDGPRVRITNVFSY